ncbi:hypothetical protein Misp01_41760 [Microtetraspora sp. NBRC 13810]|uniref:hypothetical protein n=1 Tax=Microtetraspora sp. NBRC 13810 TaxID=3030990 RepID=UPI0025554FD4|nr:hypothetical protein [Microtetraspora sp. NBRC 13810]GLW09047.1 hypothetical protein Misp01_41760 [Microtetraspora sp. NBRC 13810]
MSEPYDSAPHNSEPPESEPPESEPPAEDRSPALENVEFAPYPVILDPAGPVTVVIDLAVSGGAEPYALLRDPVGKETELRPEREATKAEEVSWRARHEIPADGPAGRWLLLVRVAGTVDEIDFAVLGAGERDRTLFTGFDARPRRVWAGSPVTFTGRLGVVRGEGTEGLAGRPISLVFQRQDAFSWEEAAVTETDRAGAFVFVAEAEDTGHWRAQFTDEDDDGFAAKAESGARSASVLVLAPPVPPPPAPPEPTRKSKITSYSVRPRTVGQGGSITHKGTLWIQASSGGWRRAANLKIGAQNRKTKSGTWRDHPGSATTRDSGDFTLTSSGVPVPRFWRVKFGGRSGVKWIASGYQEVGRQS